VSVTCVVLDIGGVLEVTPETGWLQCWESDVHLALGSTRDRLADVFEAGSLGAMSEPEVQAAVRAALPVSDEDLERFWSLLWQEYLGCLNVELFTWFRGLRPRWRTGILSNSFVGAREREQERYGFHQACDVLAYSHEVGVAKPDPEAYALTAQRLGACPEQIVLLDDTPFAIDGARAAGWHAVQFATTEQAIVDVEAYLRDRAGIREAEQGRKERPTGVLSAYMH
jgi:FMN phosphatase YigB (HAD superfamily)